MAQGTVKVIIRQENVAAAWEADIVNPVEIEVKDAAGNRLKLIDFDNPADENIVIEA